MAKSVWHRLHSCQGAQCLERMRPEQGVGIGIGSIHERSTKSALGQAAVEQVSGGGQRWVKRRAAGQPGANRLVQRGLVGRPPGRHLCRA